MADAVWLFMMSIFVVIIIINLYIFWKQGVFGEEYKFNMTSDLEKEQRVLNICIETDIKLDFCDLRYGGKGYGESVQ